MQAEVQVYGRNREIGGGLIGDDAERAPVLKKFNFANGVVLAVTANCMVASSAVFVSPTRMENVAESEGVLNANVLSGAGLGADVAAFVGDGGEFHGSVGQGVVLKGKANDRLVTPAVDVEMIARLEVMNIVGQRVGAGWRDAKRAGQRRLDLGGGRNRGAGAQVKLHSGGGLSAANLRRRAVAVLEAGRGVGVDKIEKLWVKVGKSALAVLVMARLTMVPLVQ